MICLKCRAAANKQEINWISDVDVEPLYKKKRSEFHVAVGKYVINSERTHQHSNASAAVAHKSWAWHSNAAVNT